MSVAKECDRCATLYKPERGTISIGELYICDGVGDCNTSDSWSEIDFCPRCSADVRAALGAAIDETPKSSEVA